MTVLNLWVINRNWDDETILCLYDTDKNLLDKGTIRELNIDYKNCHKVIYFMNNDITIEKM